VGCKEVTPGEMQGDLWIFAPRAHPARTLQNTPPCRTYIGYIVPGLLLIRACSVHICDTDEV